MGSPCLAGASLSLPVNICRKSAPPPPHRWEKHHLVSELFVSAEDRAAQRGGSDHLLRLDGGAGGSISRMVPQRIPESMLLHCQRSIRRCADALLRGDTSGANSSRIAVPSGVNETSGPDEEDCG